MPLLSERDMLALEWELHHVRWLANAIAGNVSSGIRMRLNVNPANGPLSDGGDVSVGSRFDYDCYWQDEDEGDS